MLSRDSRENILRRTAIVKERRSAQPKGKSAGCSFRNPEGDSAGRLIEECGLKGCREGGAFVSPVHANFIINDGHASAKDVLCLLNKAERAVYDRFGIRLEREIKIIGEE
jgi:UDP-N-acetylmuramate dehydrogenase